MRQKWPSLSRDKCSVAPGSASPAGRMIPVRCYLGCFDCLGRRIYGHRDINRFGRRGKNNDLRRDRPPGRINIILDCRRLRPSPDKVIVVVANECHPTVPRPIQAGMSMLRVTPGTSAPSGYNLCLIRPWGGFWIRCSTLCSEGSSSVLRQIRLLFPHLLP